ncbi:probable hexosyltransferase MUCI70 isoform X2 [Euphorbia lathyris]|uniref:probable hexosyltransferase MUCI70 isoform X2 n=1 Tax=Euphorbia lathyris TaxID=212925 RepID=UPI0033133EA7
MEREIQLSISMRLSRRADRSSHSSHSKNAESGFFSSGKLPSDCPMKIIWKGGFIRLVLVDGIVWMVLFFIVLLFHVWSCQSSNSFFSAQHKHHRNIYEEADANKRRKGYARPLIDLHMKIYGYEGLEPWSVKKSTVSDVPEGAVIIGGHTAINNLFICLWFNERNNLLRH